MAKDVIWTTTNRDKMRQAFQKGKRTITIKGQKFAMAASPKKGYFTVKLADSDKKAPFALLETVQLRTKLDKKTGEAIALHAKQVKEGEKTRPNFEARKAKKKGK